MNRLQALKGHTTMDPNTNLKETCAPWIALSRKLAAETLLHWRGFVLEDEQEIRKKFAAWVMLPVHEAVPIEEKRPSPPRKAYELVRESCGLAAKHVKAVALARRNPTSRQLSDDLGWTMHYLYCARDWPADLLVRALEDFARRFVGTDFAPRFARRVLSTVKGTRK